VFSAGRNGVAVTQSDSLSNSPPVIVNTPQSGIFCAYEPLSLTVDAAGFGALHYQWYKDGSPLPDSDYRVFNNPYAGFDAAGQYVVLVTDGNGQSVTSQPAAVAIGLPQLNIKPLSNSVNISWPSSAIDYSLQSALTLSGPWNVMPYTTTNSVAAPATNGAGFYRLMRN
jgi:hypothetical protein